MVQLKGAGTEDKRKVALAAALGLAVLVMALRTIFSGPDSAPAPPSPPVAARPATAAVVASPAAARPLSTSRVPVATTASAALDPSLHPELMAETETYLYRGSGRNIFSQSSGSPVVASARIEPVRGPVRPSQRVQVNPGPPPPPAIDLHFFGYAARTNGARRAFLSHGDEVFVASEGDVVGHRYRIVHIAPTSIEVEDLPYHNTQSLPLVQN